MALVDDLILVAKSRNDDDAGTDNRHNLTINIDGADVFNLDFPFGLGEGIGRDETGYQQCAILPGSVEPPLVADPFDTDGLTDSSIRLGVRGDDAWAPRHVLLIGRVRSQWVPGRSVALAIETDLTHWLSSDPDEGRLTMRLRLARTGDGAMLIRRVLLVIYTSRQDNADTDSDVQLQIAAGGSIVLTHKMTHSFGRGKAHLEFVDVDTPFTRNDIETDGIDLSILGADAWLPGAVFLFGVDTASDRPNEMVTLVALPGWDLGWLSTDASEGKSSIPLPLSL
jgi:hypothetical protein